MKITNRWGIPEAIVEAIRRDPYNSGGAEITASSIGGPPRIRQLMKEHGHELEEDASDAIWKLYGQAIHVVLERANRTELREKRLHAEIGGAKVSGQFDTAVYFQGKLTDYKFTSAWTVVYGGREDWAGQMNTLAELLDRNGVEPMELEVACLLRDWSKSKGLAAAKKNQAAGRVVDSYPTKPVVVFGVPLWTKEERVQWIEARVQLHRAAALGDVADCSEEDRWIRKAGDKPTRCLDWCAVSRWCPQHQAYLERKGAA